MRQTDLQSLVRGEVAAQALHLTDRDERHEAHEEQEQQAEEADASEEQTEVYPCRAEESPAGGQEVPMQRHDDDDESLEPHAAEDAGGHGGEHRDAGAEALEP